MSFANDKKQTYYNLYKVSTPKKITINNLIETTPNTDNIFSRVPLIKISYLSYFWLPGLLYFIQYKYFTFTYFYQFIFCNILNFIIYKIVFLFKIEEYWIDMLEVFYFMCFIIIFFTVLRMEEQVTVPITVTFQQQTTNKQQTNTKADMSNMVKHSSQPKFRTYKQQILKIPKVKQILNKDRYVYSQDIQKRLELIGSLKNDQYEVQEMTSLCQLRKNGQPPTQDKKKNKRHKTNFKIPLTRKNVESLNNLIVKHISHNQKYKNEEVIFLKQYAQNAPYDLKQLQFIDKLDQVKSKFSEKYPDLNKKVLSKNKLTLENVILNRNIRREIKLDNKKQEKLHAIKVFSTIDNSNQHPLVIKKSDKKEKAKN